MRGVSADGPKVMPWTSLVLDRQEHQRGLRGRKGRQVLVIGELAHAPRVELADRGAVLTLNENHEQAMVTLAEQDFDVVVADLSTCPAALRVVTLLKDGSSEFLRIGFSGKRWRESGGFSELTRLMKKEMALLSRRQRPRAEPEVEPEAQLEGLVGRSAPMRAVFSKILRLRMNEDPVLIRGERGTGKTSIAHAIHHSSQRQLTDIRAIDCSKFVSPGGFRAALEVARAAGPSTVILEHVDTLVPEAQQEFIRFVTDLSHGSLRFLATTTKNLSLSAELGAYSRTVATYLGRTEILLAPLRDRREDIVPIAQQVLDDPDLLEKYGSFELEPPLIERLLEHPFPGNVAELVGMVEELAASSMDGQRKVKAAPTEAFGSELDEALFRAFHSSEQGWAVPRERIEKAKMRHSLTPFVVLSPDTGTEYAVIISAPELSFVRDPRQMPVVNTVMTIEIAAYLGTAKPQA